MNLAGKVRGILWLLAVAGLMAPWASAAAADGVFIAEGGITLGPGARASTEPHAFLLNGTKDVSFFEFASPKVHLCKMQETSVYLAGQVEWVREFRPTCYWQEAVTIRLTPGDHAGWIGYRAGMSPIHGVFSPDGQMRVTPSSVAVLASPEQETASSQEDTPGDGFFVYRLSAGHVSFQERGALQIEGSGSLKILGLDVEITSATNSTIYRTSRQEPSGPVDAERRAYWLTLTFDEADFRIESHSNSIQVVAPVMELGGDVEARFTSRSGSLQVGDERYLAARGEVVTLEGDLRFVVRPAPGTTGRAAALTVDGNARTVSMGAILVPVEPAHDSAGLPLSLLAGAAVVVAGGGALVALHVRRPRRENPSSVEARGLDTLREAVELEFGRGNFEIAARLIRSYRREHPHAPSSLGHEEGQLLLRAAKAEDVHPGHRAELMQRALRAFEAASRTETDGQADVWAAVAAARLGYADVAEQHVLRALDQPHMSMDLLGELERMEELRPFTSTPDAIHALNAAYARILRSRRTSPKT